MQTEFWVERWERNQIGFHQAVINARLQKFWPRLELPEQCAVFLPLCGKTLDMHWLYEQGHSVFGIELSSEAVDAFFAEAGIERQISETITGLEAHSAPGYTLYRGDFFDLSAPDLPGCMGVFDRGALVALPPDMREVYADHIQRVMPEGSKTLLLTLEYDQALVSGPPFSVTLEEVTALYSERCSIEVLHSAATQELPPHFAAQGLKECTEAIYLLQKLE